MSIDIMEQINENEGLQSVQNYTDEIWRFAICIKGTVEDYYDCSNEGKVATRKFKTHLLNNINGIQMLLNALKNHVEESTKEREMI
jgi:hypothetical protein